MGLVDHIFSETQVALRCHLVAFISRLAQTETEGGMHFLWAPELERLMAQANVRKPRNKYPRHVTGHTWVEKYVLARLYERGIAEKGLIYRHCTLFTWIYRRVISQAELSCTVCRADCGAAGLGRTAERSCFVLGTLRIVSFNPTLDCARIEAVAFARVALSGEAKAALMLFRSVRTAKVAPSTAISVQHINALPFRHAHWPLKLPATTSTCSSSRCLSLEVYLLCPSPLYMNVISGGHMGGGLAQAFLNRGFAVHVKDVSDDAITATKKRIVGLFEKKGVRPTQSDVLLFFSLFALEAS